MTKMQEILLGDVHDSLQYEIYHENSKYHSLMHEQNIEANLQRVRGRKYKSLPYTYSFRVDLDNEQQVRTTHRQSNQLSKDAVGIMLNNTYGVDRSNKEHGNSSRGVTSIGEIFPLELFVLCSGIDELNDGLYHYDVEYKSIGFIRSFQNSDLRSMGLDEKVNAPCCLIFITGLFQDVSKIYGERCYRNLMIETGKVIHNFELLGTDCGCEVLEMSFYMDFKCEDFLGIDGHNHMLLSIIHISNA